MANNFEIKHSSTPEVALKAGTLAGVDTYVGEIIDLAKYNGCLFIITSGALTDTLTTTVLESDDSAMSGATEVADEQLLEPGSADFIATDDDVSKSIGCNSKKRYVQLQIVAAAAALTTSGVALKTEAYHQPTA